MARLRLTIGKFAVATEQETATIPFTIDEFSEQNYLVSLKSFKLLKKMYQPTEIITTLHIYLSDGIGWEPVDKKTIMRTFSHQRVSVDVLDVKTDNSEDPARAKAIDTIGNDFYVHEVIPTYKPSSLFVELRIYSLDKLLTISNCCSSWTAKKLASHILDSQLPNYKIPYDPDKHVECDTSQMKHLVKDGQEHIFPYLVQYNESFYDMLARTCNRWGEFLYWEDGKLRIGYDADEKKAKDIKGYYSMTFHDNTSTPPVSADGTYSSEATYDNNVLKSTVAKDGAAIVFGTINNMADMDRGADYYWLAKVGQVLTNNKPVMNFLFDTAVNDLMVWGMQESLVSQYNDKHNDAYFKKKKKYISTLDEQYDPSKKTLNQFSEFDPILKAKDYAGILAGEMLAEQNTIDVDYDTTWPELKLGNIIKVGGEEYIVVEISSCVNEKKDIVFKVMGIAKNQGTFYPMMIPSGHIRTSGPQVAVVVDADDPNKKNRVRLKYPWQLTSVNPIYEAITASDLKGHDVSDATPWLIYAASSGPAGAGVHGRHYLAEKVLVNYANNNVERPFVVGAVSTATPGKLKTGSAVLQAPNGEYIRVHEGTGKGASAFMANFTPGLSLVNGFLDFPDLFGDNEMSKAFEGGVELGDKYGIWKISGSTDKRAIDINSPWGNVSINAFTGISVNAPNGNISIRGKNVSIEAGNNLTLRSGTNIRNKFISSYGDGGFNITTFLYDAGTMAAKKLASLVESVFDLALIRSLIEVYWRPQEGALSIQSNRYLKLGAGGAMPGYPDAAYLNPKKLDERDKKLTDEEIPETLKMGPAMVELICKVPKIVGKMISNYKKTYEECISRKDEFEKAIEKLACYSDHKNNKLQPVCNSYSDLKNKFWDPQTKKIVEADMGFTAACKADSIDDVGEDSLGWVRDQQNRGMLNAKYSRSTTDELKTYILKRRAEFKEEVIAKANELLESIAKLRTEPQKLGNLKAYGLGPTLKTVPANYIQALQTAISAEKCKGSTMFKYAYNDQNAITDERTSLTSEAVSDDKLHRDALIRLIALNLVEGWGMEPKAIKFTIEGEKVKESNIAATPQRPASDEELENEAKWNLYVRSLQFTKPLKATSFLDEVAAVFDPSNFNLATPIKEYYSWGNAKAGQILFGTGSTFSMKADGTISKLETHHNQGKITRALLSEKDQNAYDRLNESVQRQLEQLCDAFEGIPLPADQAPEDDNNNDAGEQLPVVNEDHIQNNN